MAKAGGGRKESISNHTATTTGDDVSVQWMAEWEGWTKDWMGNDGATVAVAVAAVAMADVASAVVATETFSLSRKNSLRLECNA